MITRGFIWVIQGYLYTKESIGCKVVCGGEFCSNIYESFKLDEFYECWLPYYRWLKYESYLTGIKLNKIRII